MTDGLSKLADGWWRARYAHLDNAGIAAALRSWHSWRQEQSALHPDEAGAIQDCYVGATAWLRQEAQRRLAPKPRGPWLSTPDLLARYNDRLHQTGPDRWRAVCPWHDDSTPSLVVFARGWCHCFACGAHRPVADLATAWEGQVAE